MGVRRVTVVASVIVASLALSAGTAIASAPAASKKAPEVRIVQVYAPPDGTSPTVVLVDSRSTTGKQPKPLIEAELGDISEFAKVPAGHTLRLGTADGEDSGIYLDALKNGDRITLVPYATDSDPEQSSMQVLTIVEAGKRRKAGDVAEWPKVESGRATVMLFPGALLSIADVVAGFLVTPDGACAESVDPDEQDSGVGGNIPAFYVVDPGSVDLGLSDGGCTAEPIIGPETVDATAGGRVALIPYGTSLTDLNLLVVPVDRPLAAATSRRPPPKKTN